MSANQQYNGLVQIEGYGGNMRFVADGNFLRAYPDGRVSGNRTVSVNAGVKNAAGVRLHNDFQQSLNFEEMQPQVRLVGRGAVIPGNQNAKCHFPL